MTDPKREISDAALADELFAAARDDGVALHPAVGVRMRAQLEETIAERRHRSRWWRWSRWSRWFAVAVAVAAPATLALALWLLPEPASIAPVDPPAPRPIAPVAMESLVRAREVEVALELAPGKHTSVHRGASLVPGIIPEVLEGEVEFRIASDSSDELFRVRAAAVTCAVTDAVFTVRRWGDRVDVEVEEGVVRVQHGDIDEVVRTGEQWSTTDQPSRAAEILEESYRQARRSSKSRRATAEAKVQVDLQQEQQQQQQQRSLLELAAEHLRAGELDRARAIYRELEAGEASGAALGLYLSARLEARHAGRPAAALAALDRFLARFSDHALAAEARASRIEALLDLSRCDEASRALAAFEERHADAGDLIARSKSRLRTDCK